MKLETATYRLENQSIFRIAHGARTHTDTFFVRLSRQGIYGVGEATPVPYYGITPADMSHRLASLAPILEELAWDTPEELWHALDPYLSTNRFAQCALDMAAHDWYGKRLHQPLYQIWGLSLENLPVSNYTIGIDEVSVMQEKIKSIDFPLYKIKLGTTEDVAIVRALREVTQAPFRVDANGAWTVDQTLAYAPQLKALGVEFIEQPLAASDWDGMKALRGRSVLPLIADESCQVEADVTRCAEVFDGVNIKLAKCGGLTPARRMISQARKLGLNVMCGCMTESSVGISAIAHLLPLLDYVDMDGALLISNDPAQGVQLDQGQVKFTNQPGLGVTLPWTKL